MERSDIDWSAATAPKGAGRGAGSNAMRPWSGRLRRRLVPSAPSLVLSRSWKSTDAQHHELRIGAARSASLTTD